ncbi:MAG: hypothetical protein EBU84_02295 [Actinobacteria bacterium]|nr:hypothetical protein [Actinomycetota bacterium]
MELNHEFNVNVPAEQAWSVLTNVEMIAPCLPGAQLQEVEGDTYRGVVKIKVGPIVAQFKGQAVFAERDDVNKKAVLKAEGRDTGGKGNANATITAQLTQISDSVTKVNVDTDLAITGKVAQFGRGALADVSDKLLAQFAASLNELLESQPAAESAPVVQTETVAPETAAEQPAEVRKIDAPEAKPIDLIGTAGGTMAKMVAPIVIGVAAIVVLAVFIF